MNKSLIIIKRNDNRYIEIAGEESPKELCIYGTTDQAKWVAKQLSSYYAGCDFMFYEMLEE